MYQEDKFKRARKRVKAKKGFYIHLSTYVTMGIFFFSMNMLTDPFDIWWPFPMLSWGIGLAIHYFTVFGLPGTKILTKEWEDQEMERELRRVGYEPEQELYEEEPEPEHNQDQDFDHEAEDELDLREIQKERRERGFGEDDFV